MDDEFHTVVNKIRALAKTLPRNSEKRHNVTEWRKRLLTEKHDRSSRDIHAKQLLLALQSGILTAPFNSVPPAILPQVDKLDSLHQSAAYATENVMTGNRLFTSPRRGSFSPPPHRPLLSHSLSPPLFMSHPGPRHSTPYQHHRTSSSSGHTHQVSSLEVDGPVLSRVSRLQISPKHSTSKESASKTARALVFSSSSTESSDETNFLHKPAKRQVSKKLAPANFSLSSDSSDEVSDVTDLLGTNQHLKQSQPSPQTLSAKETRSRSVNFVDSGQYKFQDAPNVNHYESVKKTLDYRNQQIEDMRRQHLVKVKQLEQKCASLEAKIIRLETVNTDTIKEQQRELKDVQRQSSKQEHSLKSSYERKLHAVMGDYESQQLELEQQYMEEIRGVKEEANKRISQLKREMSRQQQEMSKSLSEAQDKIQQANLSVESTNRAKRKMIRQKDLLSEKVSSLEEKLKESKKCVQSLEEKEGQSKEYQCQLEQAMEAMKRELEEGKIEFSRKIDTLQQEVILLQTKIEAERAEGRKQLLDAENSFQVSLQEKELKFEEKMRELQSALSREEYEYRRAEESSKSELRMKEKELSDLKIAYQSQTRAIEDYQNKVEHQMDDMFVDMRKEIERLEEELKRETLVRKGKEEELIIKLSEQRAMMNEERSTLVQSLKEKHENELQLKDSTIHEVRNQVQELLKSHQQKLNEMRRSYESSKRSFEKKQESAIEKVKGELENHHKFELSALVHKHKIQLQQVEHDANLRLSVADETIVSLQSQNRSLRDDLERNLELHKGEIEELMKQKDREVKNLVLSSNAEKRTLSEALQNSRELSQQLEARIAQLQKNYELELSRLKVEYKTKQDDKILQASKQDTQDETVRSLQLQVQLLTERAETLQKQLDQSQACNRVRKHMRANLLHQSKQKK